MCDKQFLVIASGYETPESRVASLQFHLQYTNIRENISSPCSFASKYSTGRNVDFSQFTLTVPFALANTILLEAKTDDVIIFPRIELVNFIQFRQLLARQIIFRFFFEAINEINSGVFRVVGCQSWQFLNLLQSHVVRSLEWLKWPFTSTFSLVCFKPQSACGFFPPRKKFSWKPKAGLRSWICCLFPIALYAQLKAAFNVKTRALNECHNSADILFSHPNGNSTKFRYHVLIALIRNSLSRQIWYWSLL